MQWLFAVAAMTAQAEAQVGVEDPRAFVAEMFESYGPESAGDLPDPSHSYSSRLRALFEAFRLWQSQQRDGAGALDFDWWVNGQDWEISNVWLVEFNLPGERRVIEAHWRNYGREDQSRFFFIRENGRWVLDEVINGSGRGGEGWRLTALLRERDE